jgi:hypothetical protein
MSRYYPTSCTALWGSGGGGVAVDLLLKTMNYMHIIIKSSIKLCFMENP